MFKVGNKSFVIRFNQEKFRALDPRVSAELLIELFSSASNESIMSDKALNSLVVVGLEDESGVCVPSDEADRHYRQLLEINGEKRLKEVVAERFFKDMPGFIKSLERKNN